MNLSHKGMGIDECDWRAFIDHLEAMLDGFKVPVPERQAVLTFIEGTKRRRDQIP